MELLPKESFREDHHFFTQNFVFVDYLENFPEKKFLILLSFGD